MTVNLMFTIFSIMITETFYCNITHMVPSEVSLFYSRISAMASISSSFFSLNNICKGIIIIIIRGTINQDPFSF